MPRMGSWMLAVLAILALVAATHAGADLALPHQVFLPFVGSNAGPIPTLTATATPIATDTLTPTNTHTSTSTATEISTPTPSDTLTPAPTLTRTSTPKPTNTLTPTPPFAGFVTIDFADNSAYGNHWPAGAQVSLSASGLDLVPRESISCSAEPSGLLTCTRFATCLHEGDWITVTYGGQLTGFPIVLLSAVGNPRDDTIEGTAQPWAFVDVIIGHGGEWYAQWKSADEQGHFRFDYSSVVDWTWGDYVRVGQFLNANGEVAVQGGSPQFPILPPPTPTPTLTPSHDAPPFLRISAPGETFVGEEVVLDASGSWDVDGDPFVLEWTQFHNPDRYTGNEFVTGNDVLIRSLDGSVSAMYPASITGTAQIRFSPEWPGNYRFELVARDRDGEKRQAVDVLVHLRQSQFEMRLSSLDSWWGPESPCVAADVFERARTSGANWVEYNIWHEVENTQGTAVTRCTAPGFPACAGPTDEQLCDLVGLAHADGLKFFVSTNVMCAEKGCEPHQIQPIDMHSFFASWSERILELAVVAEQCGADMLSVGMEMYSTHPMADEWRQLIHDVRGVYSGALTYLGLPMYTMQEYPFQAYDLLDYIGMYYIPDGSAPSEGNTHPKVSDMEIYMERQMQEYYEIQVLPVLTQYGKPIFVWGVGCQNYDGVNMQPMWFQRTGDPDNQEQVDWLEAALRVLSRRPWLYGVSATGQWLHRGTFAVSWETGGRPAGDAVSLWYGR